MCAKCPWLSCPVEFGTRLGCVADGFPAHCSRRRGGGEYGEEWHTAGTLGRKQNVFDDFMYAAKHLTAEGYTTKDQLAIMGGSNGGLVRVVDG